MEWEPGCEDSLGSQPQEFPEVPGTPARQAPWPGWEVAAQHRRSRSLLCRVLRAVGWLGALSEYSGANGGACKRQKYPAINSTGAKIKAASRMAEHLARFQASANTKPRQSREALGVYDVEITGWWVTHFQLMVSRLLEENVSDVLGLDPTSVLQAKCRGHEASVSETE